MSSISSCKRASLFALQVDERLIAVQDLESRLKQCQDQADVFVNRERIFDLPPSPFTALAGASLSVHCLASLPSNLGMPLPLADTVCLVERDRSTYQLPASMCQAFIALNPLPSPHSTIASLPI